MARRRGNGADFLKYGEFVSHGLLSRVNYLGRRSVIGVTDDIAADINAQLYSAGHIEYQNILQIDVLI